MLFKCDLIGQKITLKYDGESKLNSELGGILTIMNIILVFFFIISIGQEVILKENPNLIIQTILEASYPNFTFTLYHLFMALE